MNSRAQLDNAISIFIVFLACVIIMVLFVGITLGFGFFKGLQPLRVSSFSDVRAEPAALLDVFLEEGIEGVSIREKLKEFSFSQPQSVNDDPLFSSVISSERIFMQKYSCNNQNSYFFAVGSGSSLNVYVDYPARSWNSNTGAIKRYTTVDIPVYLASKSRLDSESYNVISDEVEQRLSDGGLPLTLEDFGKGYSVTQLGTRLWVGVKGGTLC